MTDIDPMANLTKIKEELTEEWYKMARNDQQ